MKHADIIARLTLEQRCALLAGATAFGTRAIPSVGLPALEFSDGPHGLRHQAEGANNLGLGTSDPATCFPTAVTLADSWDEALVERVGQALGEEAAVEGVNVILGPGVCIKRSPLCGRDFEYFSEDPFLAGKMGAAYVRGVESTGVGTCVKHFAANSQETRRQVSDSVLDERTLREIYLTAFEIVVREGHPSSVMSSYNLVNGTYANENEHLLKEVLRGEWGFDGAVVTDWGGSNDHVAGVRAGSTFEMPGGGLDSTRELIAAVRQGRLCVNDLDARVDEAIELILSTHEATATAPSSFDADAHHELAREAAAAGIVLLKNDATHGTPLLPLVPGTRVALVGDFAETPRYQGAGSSLVNSTRVDTLLDAMRGKPSLELVGYEPGFLRDGGQDEGLSQRAVELVRTADVVVCCLGLPEAYETEGADRTSLLLPGNQVALLHAVARANPNVVVLLSSGSVVETGWAVDARSLLYLGLGGQAGASAALDVLTGRVNPSGKLAETWPHRLEDTPTFGNFPSDDFTAEYREGPYVGYRYYATTGVPVAYPFGFGLSYTTFSYTDLAVEVAPDGSNGKASLTLANTGHVAGAEVVQLYVSKPNATVFRPALELKGFAKVTLGPGESRRVTIPLDARAFRYFNVRTGAWEIEGGTYVVRVGGSSVDLPLEATIELAGTGAPDPYTGKPLESYRSGRAHEVTDAEFEALLGHAVPTHGVTIDRNLCFRDAAHSLSPALWAVSAALRGLVAVSERAGRPDLNVLFTYNMPLRALAKNAPKYVSMGLVDALVREARGWGVAGAMPAGALAWLVRKAGWLDDRRLSPRQVFALTWLLWAAGPPAYEFVLNLVRNWRGERLLENLPTELFPFVGIATHREG